MSDSKKRKFALLIFLFLMIMFLVPMLVATTSCLTGGFNATVVPTTTVTGTATATTTTYGITTIATTITTTECAPDYYTGLSCGCMGYMEAFDYYSENQDVQYLPNPEYLTCYDRSGPYNCGEYNESELPPMPNINSNIVVPTTTFNYMADFCWLVLEPCHDPDCNCMTPEEASEHLQIRDQDELVQHICEWKLCGINESGVPKLCFNDNVVNPDATVPPNYAAISAGISSEDSQQVRDILPSAGIQSPAPAMLIVLIVVLVVVVSIGKRKKE